MGTSYPLDMTETNIEPVEFGLLISPGVATLPSMRALIVEDDAQNRELLRRLLIACWKIPEVPLEVVAVGTLQEGLDNAPGANVTILDLSLPGSDVEHTLAQIRNFMPPVIVLTGSDDPDITSQCLAAGANHVFVKGSATGLIPAVFESMQKDLIRKICARQDAKRAAV